MNDVERIQNFNFKDKGSYLPLIVSFVLGIVLSGWLVRDHYIDKFTLDNAEYVEVNQKLQAENKELSDKLELINDAHVNAQQALDGYERQLAEFHNQEPIYIEKVKYIQPQACHFQELPEPLRIQINEAILSYYR